MKCVVCVCERAVQYIRSDLSRKERERERERERKRESFVERKDWIGVM